MIQEQVETIRGEKENEPDRPVGTAELAGRNQAGAPDASSHRAVSADRAALFADNELGEFRRRWRDVQTGFVDDPRTAVRNADELVAR